LIGSSQTGQEILAVSVAVFGSGKDRSNVIAGMAHLASGQVGVIEIEIADERAVIKCRQVRASLPASDQCAFALRAGFPGMLANRLCRSLAEHRDGAPD
jgi:hypothetical protein